MPKILRGKCNHSPHKKHEAAVGEVKTKQKKGIYYYADACRWCNKKMSGWRKL